MVPSESHALALAGSNPAPATTTMRTPVTRLSRLLNEGASFIVELPGQAAIDLDPDVMAALDFKTPACEVRKMQGTKSGPQIELTAWWGNDDVDASIQVTHSEWEAIQNGGQFEYGSSYFYEGKDYSAWWTFADGHVTIKGDDGMECVVELPVTELDARPVTPPDGND